MIRRNLVVQCWTFNDLLVVQANFPSSDFANHIIKNYDFSGEPLDQTSRIAKSVDDFFIEHKHQANKYYKALVFNESQVVITKEKGWFSSLFNN